jgi:hypothetical protein
MAGSMTWKTRTFSAERRYPLGVIEGSSAKHDPEVDSFLGIEFELTT